MALRLTGEQLLAAASDERLVNVVSGPGSGKTTMSAARFGTCTTGMLTVGAASSD